MGGEPTRGSLSDRHLGRAATLQNVGTPVRRQRYLRPWGILEAAGIITPEPGPEATGFEVDPGSR